MNDKVFLDTNILIYSYTSTEPDKQAKARVIANLPSAIISTQVLKEFANIVHRKFELDWTSIHAALTEIEGNFNIHLNTSTTIKKACHIAQRYHFFFYDSLIIAAALEANCTTLYSEDMQHEQIIEERLTVRNPFV